jgi:diaminopimelate decarboxylase
MHLSNDKLIHLAFEHESPLYVYNGDLVLTRYKELHAAIPWKKLRILYAMKANYNPAILKLLLEAGASIDAVSPGDVILALKSGFPAKKILFTANNITDEEMHEVRRLGVLFNIDSLSRLEKYGATYPDSEVCLRFNPDVVAGAHENIRTGGHLTKFGILLSSLKEVKEIVARFGMKVVALHKHTGSGIRDMDSYLEAVRNLLSIATAQNFPHLRFIDFGGGLPVPYHPEEKRFDYPTFGRKIADCLSNLCDPIGKELEIYFEPGKYLVAESGYLVVTVNTVKDNRARLMVGTDSGFSQLIRPMFYDAYHHIENLSNPEGKPYVYDVCGNICETGDRFATDREIPEIREGDLLAIRNAGAYCYAMGSVYNLRAMPPEVLVCRGEARLVRQRLTSEELIEKIMRECR